jgi:hypothetical protein
MNAAEQRLHSGTPLSGEQSIALRATAARLQGLQATIQNTYAALRTAGLYEANRHPVAAQIATWRASLASRLDAASQPPAAGRAAPPAAVTATAPITAAQIVDRPTAAVDAALQAIGQWGQLARQLVEMPADAKPERRKEVEGLVMRAGQQLQQALVHPEVIRVMKASSADGTGTASASIAGAASASPPPNGKDPRGKHELTRRLQEALINAVGSSLGDLLEHFTGGAQISPERLVTGQLIAASIGFLLPASLSGPVRGSLINGAASGAEAVVRQKVGVDPEDPAAVAASFFFAAGATEALHRLNLGRFAKWLDESVVSNKTRVYLSPEPPSVRLADVISERDRQLEALDRMGVKYHPADEPSRLDRRIDWDMNPELPWGQGPVDALILNIDKLPPPGADLGPYTRAFLHPKMAGYVGKLGDMGYKLQVDTSSRILGIEAYHGAFGRKKVIALSARSPWHAFVHEFQHAEFAEYLKDDFDRLQKFVATGRHVRFAMGSQAVEMLGEDRVNRLQVLLEKGLPEIAVNETLSVDAQLAILGVRKYIPVIGSRTEAYALIHQVTELKKLTEYGHKLSAAQVKSLRDARIRLMMIIGYESAAGFSLMGAVSGLGYFGWHGAEKSFKSNENHGRDSH